MSVLKTRLLNYITRDRRDSVETDSATNSRSTAITAEEEKAINYDQTSQINQDERREIDQFLMSEASASERAQSQSEQEMDEIRENLDDDQDDDTVHALTERDDTPSHQSSEEMDDGIIVHEVPHNQLQEPTNSNDDDNRLDREHSATPLPPQSIRIQSEPSPIPQRVPLRVPLRVTQMVTTEQSNMTAVTQSLTLQSPSADLSTASTQESTQKHSTSITIETTTTPKIYDIEWRLDEDSIRIGSAKNKRKTRDSSYSGRERESSDDEANGVIEALFVQNNIRFKLELCITGWVNSNRGYAAFYLTIPHHPVHHGSRLVARFSVAIKDTDKSKTSSIRDDFHLGVGFPNLCSEQVLRDSAQRNGGELVLAVKIEIFKTESKVNQLDQQLYNKYAKHFGVEPVTPSSTDSDLKQSLRYQSNSKSIQNKVLANMFRDKSFCDVSILSKTVNGEKKSIDVHKCVLLHSSVVFQRMFTSFIEGQDNVINLEESLWSHHIIHQLVHFLYFAQIEPTFCTDIESLFQLFCVAEYYAIGSLVTECCNQFILTLSPETVCYLLLKLENDGPQFGHVDQIRFIRKHEILWQYAINNILKVKKVKYYQQMLYTAPQILNTLIDKMTRN